MIGFGSHDIPQDALPEIVTHLEMRAPPPLRQAGLPLGLDFQRIRPDPDTYKALFLRVGGNEWLWASRLKLSNEALQTIISSPDVEIYTLTRDDRQEALLELDFRMTGDCELAFFGVAPELIGTGAGRYLMNEAITRAWARPISRFHVHTCTVDSPNALPFYMRSGFVPYKRTVEVNRDPRLDGYLPETAGAHMPLFKS